MNKALLAIFFTAIVLWGQTALADSATGTLNVTAEVVNACTLGSSIIAFGDYLGLEVQAEGTISINCASGKTVDIDISGNSYYNRSMDDGGGHSLDYNLYTTPARDISWGSGVGSGHTVSYTGIGADDTVPVYGKIFANQSSPEGSYSKALTITVSW